MASPNIDAVCLICRDTISFKNGEYSCVGRKGLASINEFTPRHNKLYPTNPIPIYKFDENGKQYVHTSCRKNYTNSRRYEQICKRQYVYETDPTSHKLRCDSKKLSFHTDCWVIPGLVDMQSVTNNLGMIASDPEDDICPICQKGFDDVDKDVSKLFQKGADKINESSRKRGRDDVVARPGQRIHQVCRKKWTNDKEIKQTLKGSSAESSSPIKKRSIRVSIGPYDPRKDCLFCGLEIVKYGGHGHDDGASEVKTDSFAHSILQHCNERSDDWAFTVRGRIEYFGKDLHAAECIYHQQCSLYFRKGQDVPEQFSSEPKAKRKRSGRPKNQDQDQAFLRACDYLETNDEEQITVSELVRKMNGFLNEEDSHPYGSQYLKEKLREHYGDSIYITEAEGLQDIVTMRDKTDNILRTYFKNAKSGDEESQKRAIIETAAKLIKTDIKNNIPSVTDQYPSCESLKLEAALSYLPSSLRTMLNLLFVGTGKHEKIAAIGQSIIQAVRPRAVIAPLQIGLASQVHHLYKSKFLVDSLSVMGFSSSYGEVQRFQKNAASVVAPDILDGGLDRPMVSFAADNVDHNILTLDGKGTFHGMGMIAATTPGKQMNRVVPRNSISTFNIKEMCPVEIVDYRFSTYARRNIMFEMLPELHFSPPPVDILWELSFCFNQEMPNWQGLMHILHSKCEHPGKSTVTFLPMIDMYPGDPTCILSTLTYICNLAERNNIAPIITFDQPLFWKASEIIYNAPKDSYLNDITLRLGSFHTLMNVLGAIGTLMQGSGLTDILEAAFGENAVKHMMTGKSVQRALRGHSLIEKCLNGMLISEMMDGDPSFSNSVQSCEEMFTSLSAGDVTLDFISGSDDLKTLHQDIEKRKLELSERSRTSKLWVAYMRMVEIARMLVMADRMGSWERHLGAIGQSLPLVAAAGHFNYIKSAYLYLQNMTELESRNPDVFRKFQDGYHVIRRTDKFWAGLGCDLVIEQTLMRSLKTPGGLTRGSGMTEEQRNLWTMSSPICSEYNIAMQDFNNREFVTSEQHKEGTTARLRRDQMDLGKIREKLELHNPFSTDPNLRNIVTGVVAQDNVNVDDYMVVGEQIIEKMKGQPVFAHTCKRKDKARTLGDAVAVKVTTERTIDPALLFQRLIVISRTGEIAMEEVLEHELSPFPPALFEANNVFRKPDKAQLAKAIDDHACSLSDTAVTNVIPKTEKYVLDGGSLIHRVQWTKGSTYGAIADTYVDFTLRNYGTATVVFDGYLDTPSIKDNAHDRRQQKHHPKVSVTPDTVFSGKKDEFLSNGSNKQGLIDLISEKLREKECSVINTNGDADYDIVQAAIATSKTYTTTLIGEDTDILVLLLHHATSDGKTLYFRSDNKSRKQLRVYDITTLKRVFDDRLCMQLLFIHAFTGSDTTSRIFGVGKKTFLEKFLKGDNHLESCADAFTKPDQTCDIIEMFGNQAMSVVFGGKTTQSLSSLRHSILIKKVISATSFVTPERLPPTASATKYHSLRVYYQIMTWLGKETGLHENDWGWKCENNVLKPVMCSKNAAPDNLLKVVHCNCTTGCTTQRCTCRGYGLQCTSACGQCQIELCENPHNITPVDQENNDSDDD